MGEVVYEEVELVDGLVVGLFEDVGVEEVGFGFEDVYMLVMLCMVVCDSCGDVGFVCV